MIDKVKQKNVLGETLEVCSLDPVTGWYRDGCCNTDENDHGTHTVCAKVNDTPNAPGVFGVFFGYDSDEGSTDFIGSWNDFYVAAVGNYFIRIAAQETVQIGDLISSDGTGCGVVQATDAITSKTVAKVTSTKKHTVYEDGSYLVTCVLYCG